MTAHTDRFFLTGLVAAQILVCAVAAVAGTPGWEALNTGITHAQRGEYEQAVADFTEAISSGDLADTNLVRATYNRGVAYDALGRTDQALAAYSEALRLKPDFSPALNNRANLYRRQGRLEEARQDYWAALAISGSAAEYAYYGLGQIAQAQNNTDLALGFYNRALKVDPQFETARAAARQLGATPPPALQARAQKTETARAEPALPPPDPPALRLGPAERNANRAEPHLAAGEGEHAAPTAGGSTGEYWVQVGSYLSHDDAEADWRRILKKAGGVLAHYRPVILSADLPEKGRVFRLRISETDRSEALKLCESMIAHNLDCMPIRK